MQAPVEPIRGHLCAGLIVFQEHAEAYRPCRPILDTEGRVCGCDETNWMPFQFCPFCGEEFPRGPSEQALRAFVESDTD
jgi:hypothetical protein